MDLRARPFGGEADLAALEDLARRVPDPLGWCPPAVDLREMLDPAASDTAAHTLLWEDAGGTPAGFALVSQWLNLHFHFRPGALTPEREAELMRFAVSHAARIAQDEPGATLDAKARDDNGPAVAFLRRHGFVPGDERTLHMGRSLRAPFPAAELPPGFALRPLAGEAEVPAYVAAHRAAFGTEAMTVGYRLAILRAPGYRADFDLVALAPGGELVAFCVCNLDAEANARAGRAEGELGMVGVRPEYRGRGLGLAMVLAGLAALRDAGLERATLGVSSANASAVRVYATAGFAVESSERWWSRPL